MKSKSVVMLSGGMDSTVALLLAMEQSEVVSAVSFEYGQFHAEEELAQARKIAGVFNVPWQKVRLEDVFKLTDSALLSGVAMDKTLDSGLPSVFTPGRNIFFVLSAAMIAQRLGATQVYGGFCGDDEDGFPDCRQETLVSIENTVRLGYDFPEFSIESPLLDYYKDDIFELAQLHNKLGFIIEHTHTCYNGDRSPSSRHEWGYGCNTCPSCEKRRVGWKTFIEFTWNGGKPYDELMSFDEKL